MFKFTCPHCGQNIEASESDAGIQAECPKCNKAFAVPEITPVTPQSPPDGDQDNSVNTPNSLANNSSGGQSASPQKTMTENTGKIQLLNKYTNIRPILDALSEGKVIKQVFGTFFRVYSVIIGLILLYTWIKTFALLEYASFTQLCAILLWQLFFPIASYLCLKAIFLRGNDISKLSNSEFIISPIIATLITLHGEVALIFLGIMSVPATLLTWFSARFIIPIETGDGFLAGIVVFVGAWVIGFLIYCITRWIREWTMAIFSIAQNVDLIEQHYTRSHNPDQ